MSLLDRAETLHRGVDELKKWQRVKDQTDALLARAHLFAQEYSRLHRTQKQFSLLLRHGIAVKTSRESVPGLESFARDLNTKIGQDPALVLSPDLDIGPRFITPLKLLNQKLAADILRDWKSWVETKTPNIASDVLAILKQIRSMRKQVETVSNKLQALRLLSERPPSNEGEIEQVDIAAGELLIAWNGLNAGGIPKTVLNFLHSAGTLEGAKLDDLGSDVRSWLEERELLNSFTIRAR